LANPNDLAQVLLVGVPGLLLMALSSTASAMRRALIGVCILVVLVVTAQTGSRASVIVEAGVLLVLLFSFSWGTRLKLLVGLVVAGMIVVPFLSREQRYRYSTIFSERTDAYDPALASRDARIELLEQSIDLTIAHPVFGAGPGVFEVASAELSKERGERGLWHATHNSYTQVSSESGLPGLFFYMAVLIGTLKSSRRIWTRLREDQPDVANIGYCLWLSLVIFAINTFFTSVAFHLYLPMLAGFVVALERVVAEPSESTIPVRAPRLRRVAIAPSAAHGAESNLRA
jgi:O-antigen ligase